MSAHLHIRNHPSPYQIGDIYAIFGYHGYEYANELTFKKMSLFYMSNNCWKFGNCGNLKKWCLLRSRANFQTTIFLVLLDMESCLMAHFEGIT